MNDDREKVEKARAELRKVAEDFFSMSADDIPAEIYAAFCAGYSDGILKCRKMIEEATKRTIQ